jgi:sialidase-1
VSVRGKSLFAGLAGAALVTTGCATSVSVPASPVALTQQVLFRKKTHGYGCFRIPAIVKTNKGTLLAFAEARKKWCGDSGNIDLVVRRSTNGGATWGSLKVVWRGSGTHGNPAPVVDAATGRITVLTTYNSASSDFVRTPYMLQSTDDGVTWSKAKSLESQIDKTAWRWYATGPSHGIQLKYGSHKGRLVVGANHSTVSGGLTGGHLVYSDDGGLNWKIGAVDDPAKKNGKQPLKPQELSTVELTNGSVEAAARNNGGTASGHRAYAISKDGGQAFSTKFTAIPGLVTPVVQGSTLRLRSTADGDRYNRILFAAPADPSKRRYLTIRSSWNEGKTWTTSKRITSDYSGYSDLVKLGTGKIGLLYEGGTSDARDEIRFARFTEGDLGGVDPSGTPTTPDVSGAGLTTFVRGGAALAAGRYGKAITLNGSDGRLELPYAESLAVGSGDFTVTSWIKYGSTSGSPPIFWAYGQDTASQVWLQAEPASKRIRGFIRTSAGKAAVVSSTKAYNDKAWHHVALQRSAGKLLLWVDGTKVASAKAPSGSVSTARPFKVYFGQRPDGRNHFAGSIDEARIYRRALTSAELAAIRTANSTGAPGLAFRLPLDSVTP